MMLAEIEAQQEPRRLSESEGREIELKLELRPEDAARIGRLKSLPQARVGLPKAEQIVTVYFDTPDLALRKAGLSLRLRHAGAKRLQTVKSGPLSEGLAAPRAEDEVPVNGAGPDIARIADKDLRARVLAVAQKESLSPQFETVVLRTTRQVKTAQGDLVELVVDLGEVRAAAEEWPISQIELELKSGSPAALFALARTLNGTAPLRLTRLTKADRGYALLGHKIGAPRKAGKIELADDVTAGEAFRLVLEQTLGHILVNEPSVVERRDIEGLHQLRVGLRRLRVILASYEALLDEKAVKALEHEIKWISAICGSARDYDVFLADIVPPARDALKPLAGGEEALTQAAQAGRADAWAKVVEAVASGRFTAFIIELASLAQHEKFPLGRAARRRDADEPAHEFAAKILDHQRKKAAKRAGDLDHLSEEERHRLRKRLKRLRYTAEFFASLYPADKTKSYLKQLSALQDGFGTLNDGATAARLVEALTAFNTGRRSALVAEAGRALVAHHREAAGPLLAESARRWAKLAKRRPFWREA